jgi:hypothetical protein
VFKAITRGDRITGELKYRYAFEFQPFARLIFSANHFPAARYATQAERSVAATGYEPGSRSPIDPEECPGCYGSSKQIVVHNDLAEALRIAAVQSSMLAQREHLVALVQHCRTLVGAVIATVTK